MTEPTEHMPGDPAPERGFYHELNVFGSPTGHIVWLEIGDTLPAAPRSFSWRLIEKPKDGEEEL